MTTPIELLLVVVKSTEMAQRQGKAETVRGRTLTSPVIASEDEVMLDPVIKVSGPAYPLDKEDYLVLTRKGSSEFLDFITSSFLGVGVVYLIEIAAKFIVALAKNTIPEIEPWEKYAVGISFLCGVVCLLAGRILPSEKKRLLKRIKQRLESEPKIVESHRKCNGRSRRS